MEITVFEIAQTWIGAREIRGAADNPQILAFLRTDDEWPKNDEVPWCSGFMNYVCKRLPALPRSRSLRARSWLGVGVPVPLADAEVGWDVVILKRGKEPQPGPEDLTAPGHVGFYAGQSDEIVYLLGGNQRDEVRVSGYWKSQVLGVRRLWSNG